MTYLYLLLCWFIETVGPKLRRSWHLGQFLFNGNSYNSQILICDASVMLSLWTYSSLSTDFENYFIKLISTIVLTRGFMYSLVLAWYDYYPAKSFTEKKE